MPLFLETPMWVYLIGTEKLVLSLKVTHFFETDWSKKGSQRLQKRHTPQKFNIAPEKWWLEDYLPIGKVTFQGRTVKLREGICEVKHLQMYAVCLAFFALNLASDFEHSVAPKNLPIQIGKRSILLGYEGW